MVIKIIGIILAIVILLVLFALILRVKLSIGFFKNGGFKYEIRVLCFSFGKKKQKKEKPESDFVKNLKKKTGLDILDKEEFKKSLENGSLTDKVSRLAALIMLFLGQVKYLFSKIRVDKLYSLIICGGDGAEAAIDYGIVCSAIYPLTGYIDASLNLKKNAQDIQIYCDFENESSIDFQLILSIRVIYLLKAFMNALNQASEMAKRMEETQNGK